jgi:hypothetical protein
LALVANEIGHDLPAFHIILGHSILDGDDRIAGDEIGEIVCLLALRANLPLARVAVAAVLEKLGCGRIKREANVLSRRKARLVDRRHDEIERGVGRGQVGGKATLIAHIDVLAGLFERRAQGVKNLRAHAQRLGEGRRAHWHDHEFLKIEGIVGVHAAIQDIHHRHGQKPRRGPSHVAIEWRAMGDGRGLGGRERHAQDGIGAEPALVRRAVEGDERLINLGLRLGIHPADGIEDFAVDGVDRLAHTLAEIALAAVAQFDRLVCPGRGSRGHRGAAPCAILKHDIDLDGWIAAAVEDFAADDIGDGCHWGLAGFYRMENTLVMSRESGASNNLHTKFRSIKSPLAR